MNRVIEIRHAWAVPSHRLRPSGASFSSFSSSIRAGAVEHVDEARAPAASRRLGRPELARERVCEAWEHLAHCDLCAWHCGVDRLRGERGICGASRGARVFLGQTEVGDESELAPCFSIAFSGCDLRCAFCITGAQSWNPQAGVPLDVPALAQQARDALARGARSIMILGGEPTVHLPAVLEFVAALPDSARLVWKTNGHATAGARAWLDGLFDVWVVDYKFGNDLCARRLARVEHYTEVVRENLLWAAPRTDLMVRHLVMPGHVECCWRPVAEWLAAALPGVKVGLWSGFWPAWQAHRHAELRRTSSGAELARAFEIAEHNGLRMIS